MAKVHLFVSLLVSFLCLASSSPTATLQDETAESNMKEMIRSFRNEVSELRENVTNLLQDHVDTFMATLETDDQERAQNHLHRTRRRSDSSLTVSPLGFANESEVTGTGDLSRVILGYHSFSPAGGTVYTHWGRDDCTDGSELVYSGMATGAYYSHKGGGVNYLCLPQDPIYSEVETSAHGTRSLLYGAEFETSTAPVFQDLHDQTPSCAICRAPPNRVTKLMIPGRNECPTPEWRLEYKGYLMSSLYSHTTRTDFVCMDENATAVAGTIGNQDGALLYMVEARCSSGGIQCGPYVNGYELTCAVCTI